MNKKMLKKKLIEYRTSVYHYNLKGNFNFVYKGFVLNHKNNQWEVYYAEKGHKWLLNIFDSEEEACDFYFERFRVYFNDRYKDQGPLTVREKTRNFFRLFFSIIFLIAGLISVIIPIYISIEKIFL